MLKSLALGLLTLGAACSTAALAHGNDQHHERNGDNHYQALDDKGSSDFQKWCEHHERCDRLEDRFERNKDLHKPAPAPEIDPAGAMGALTLLAGGLAVLRSRRAGKSAA